MKIIVVSTEPPDPFGNAAGRWYYVLANELCQRGHQVRWLAAYTREESALKAHTTFHRSDLALTLYPYPKRSGLLSKWQTLRRPYSYFISTELARDLTEALRRGYDILHLEQTWAGWLGIDVPRTLLSVHWLACIDLAIVENRTPRFLVTDQLMRRAERHIIRSHPAIRGLSSRDCEVMRRLNPNAQISNIPLAIDHRLYKFSSQEPEVPTIGIIGNMNWGPTRMAATRLLTVIWPLVKERVRGLKLMIVGWGARRVFNRHLSEGDITILEDLPEVETSFRKLTLLVFPLSLGSGTKVKVLESMAYGVPVLTTNEGVQGIEATHGVHAALGQDDETLVNLIVVLMRSRDARQVMRLAARRLIEEQHSPEPVVKLVENAFAMVMARASAS